MDRQVWLGFKAGCLSRGKEMPKCPHAQESPLQAVWEAAVNVARHPDTLEQRVEIFPETPQPPAPEQSSIVEKFEAIMDELVTIAGKVADMEYAIKMFPAPVPVLVKVAKPRKKKTKP